MKMLVALVLVVPLLLVGCASTPTVTPGMSPLQQIQVYLEQLLNGKPVQMVQADMPAIVTTVNAKLAAGQTTQTQAQLDLACPTAVLQYIGGIQQAIGGVQIPAGAGVAWIMYQLNGLQQTQINQLSQGTKQVIGVCQAFFHLPGLPV